MAASVEGVKPGHTTARNASSTEQADIRQVLQMSLPTLGVMLVDPALRFFDTVCAGQSVGGAVAQAAMAPSQSLLNMAFKAQEAIGQALTNFFATRPFDSKVGPPEEDKDASNRDLCIGALTAALGFSVITGGATALLFAVKPTALLKLVGTSDALLPSGCTYLRWCAPGRLFAMLGFVIQGAFFGMQNAVLPLKVMALLCLPISVFGDILLTLKQGRGIAGIAISVFLSQAAIFAGFGLSVTRTPWWSVKQLWHKATRKEVLKPLFSISGALIVRKILVTLGYSSMAYFATLLPTLELAAHAVTYQLFWLGTFIGEAICTVTQSIVAKEFKTNPEGCPDLARSVMRLTLQASLVLAVLQFAALHFGFINRFLSADPEVISLLSGSLAFYAALTQIPATFCAVVDGFVIATGEASNLPKVFAFALVFYRVMISVFSSGSKSLNEVWLGFNAFYYGRLIGNALFSKAIWKLLLPQKK